MQRAIIVIALLFCLLQAIASASAAPEVALDNHEHDFGDVQVGSVVQTRVSVINKGDAPLAINDVATSCGCTKAAAAGREVPPGGKTDIEVSYDSAGLSAGRKTQTVFIHSNDTKNPVSKVRIFANVIHRITIEPTSLVLRLPSFQDRVSFPVTAKNTTQQAVTLSVATFQGAIGRAWLEPETFVIEPASEVRLKIEMEVKRPEKGNTLSGELSIGTDLPEADRIKLRCLIKIDRME
ncbi:MAG: DUF1573 domain-containing protein [Desulfomonile tiedjei]|nr:DUF1573 domain-containing protein [Desulfomonile tiedjei]